MATTTGGKPSFKDPYLKSQYPQWSSYYLDYPKILDVLRPLLNDQYDTAKLPNSTSMTSSTTMGSPSVFKSLRAQKSLSSLPEHSITKVFLDELDDEIDKVTLFVIKQQGTIADKFLTLQKLSENGQFGATSTDLLHDAAHELLHLIKFLQANALAIDMVLTLHDRSAPSGIKVEHLFLTGKIGRERAMRTGPRSVERSRLGVVYRQEGINALVGLAETVFWDWVTYVRATQRDMSRAEFHERHSHHNSDDDDGATPVVEKFRDMSREVSLVKQLPSQCDDIECNNNDESSEKNYQSIRGIFLGIDAALHRLRRSSSFVERWASASGIEAEDRIHDGWDDTDTEHFIQKAAATPTDEEARNASSNLNLANSFLYMVSYYMVAPTSGEYALKLGLSPSYSGAIIGFTAVSALASTVLYSWWTSYSYKNALIFSSLCCLTGNLIYALGLPFESLTLVLIGRFLNGFGSARAINRRFIADAFSNVERTAASAAFVASGAAGMSCGPALSAAIPLFVRNDNPWWQEENAPAWIVAGLWAAFLAFLIPYFQDPPKQHEKTSIVEKNIEMSGSSKGGGGTGKSNGETTPLLTNGSSTAPPSTKEKPLWERPVCLVTIFLVFLLKLVLELVLSSAAPIADYYFGWSPSLTGWYLALGNGLVLPAVSLVTFLSRYYQDRQLILFSQVLMLVGSLVVIYYTPDSTSYPLVQYILGTCVLFIAPNTMEGPSMSLLSKNIPKSLRSGVFNLGFFTTEAGFGGRVVADSYLTICGTWGIDHLVNYLYGSLALVNACTLALVYFSFDELVEPLEHSD